MLFNIRILFAVIALIVIVAEARPQPDPQEFGEQEFLVDELPPPADEDIHIDADSFPLAPDVPPGVAGVDDYHIRK